MSEVSLINLSIVAIVVPVFTKLVKPQKELQWRQDASLRTLHINPKHDPEA